ncbi:MAG: 50S ribosomal protein L16 [Candidatus Colwellbacteria bacterium]
MLMPKKVKHRKWHKGRRRGSQSESRGTEVSFGEYGLQSLGSAWLNSRQIEAGRRAITHYLKREGRVWIRVFPDKPVTAKPPETGMGKGKGAVDHYVFPVKPGRMIFELDGISEDKAKVAFDRAKHKLPFKTRFVKKS